MMGVEDLLRLTVAGLISRTGERQNELVDGFGLSQAQASRKQGNRQHWLLEDVDRLAAHFGLHYLDLLAGPTHAIGVPHGSTLALRPADLPPAAAAQLSFPAVQLPAQPPQASAAPLGPRPTARSTRSVDDRGVPGSRHCGWTAGAVRRGPTVRPVRRKQLNEVRYLRR
ncbi:hypothetical protein ACIPRL_35390 [Streptomyces sp. NPDC090085]|uniref:hypothetical protein n=1 Tax=Streptomyces sp. NPDC090085 TaxID=3365943 RepID=UPI00381DEAFB